MLIILAIVIAFPLAVLGMDRWLDAFAYRAEIGVGIFVFTALLAFVITLATNSFQSIRAALANPAASLRSE